MVGVDMYPMCIQYVSNVYPMCSASKVYPKCIQWVSNEYQMGIIKYEKEKKMGEIFLGHKKNFGSKNVFGQKNLWVKNP